MTSISPRPHATAEIRQAFLHYFEEQGHRLVPSHSLLPAADPTLLFVNAGMVPFKDYLADTVPAPYTCATTTQKCLRVSGKHNDLENVGRTRRHHTFFEMLGNFSFSEYFKRGAIEHGWRFLTEILGLDTSRLIVTYFEGNEAVPADTEARDLWLEMSGLPADRVVAMTEKDNFWSMGETGPCGPCSEIYYDLWPEQESFDFPEDEARYMEIWNLVFMQYDRQLDGTLLPLPSPSIDTGMGLERIASVVQGGSSNYAIDLLSELISLIERMSKISYGGRFDPREQISGVPEVERDVAFRVIADHARTTAFLIAEAIFPDNEGRGYVLRRVMRRAIRFGRKLGFDGLFLHQVCDKVVDLMGDVFPELRLHREVIQQVVRQEEERFGRTLVEGERLIEQALDRLQESGGPRVLDGDTVFMLHDSKGFPTDLTALIAAERGFEVDMQGFSDAMERQRARGRASWRGAGENSQAQALIEAGLQTQYLGYVADELSDVEVLAILLKGERVSEGQPEQTVEVVLKRTPFYGESGGQIGDRGTFSWDGGLGEVVDTQKPAPDLVLHRVRITQGTLREGQRVDVHVDPDHRRGVAAHHSATHLLHHALREILGSHVKQRGSLVQAGRLRFDFSHFAAMTPEQLVAVEQLANRMVLSDQPAEINQCSMDEARDKGALMFFGDKYGERVRVVELGESVELCGGTHVGRTGEIGLIKIISEVGVSAGVRRLEAECHLAVLGRMQKIWDEIGRVAQRFNVKTEDADARVGQVLDQLKRVEKDNRQLRQRLVLAEAAASRSGDVEVDGETRKQFGDFVAVARVFEGVGGKDLGVIADQERDKVGKGAVLMLSVNKGGKVALVVAVSKPESNILHAGKTIQALAPLAGGRGGGRPDFAQAGGSDPSRVEEVIAAFFEAVEGALG